ncbi:TIR domain-containing protein [Massilia sp. IC2-477]|uniref:toll/interleukin-1 receptor domain-containing protein n=1 Tax=Massilia sp. IC2-477 TaxID=2887198 RepID=UPI001D102D83|nr:toll/interleukin-1 receptor domain-containing protein [Massilia sp. IC2-477]MCC2957381.1 TIR domain-containing protein [Massilia sp. IC2-477]
MKYRAFLSYSHVDTLTARWLQSRLESFRIDSDLVGRKTAIGEVPANLSPIFRDRGDFRAGLPLPEQTLLSLDDSAAMIVLCSPAAAKSFHVNEEIRLFRSRHPERPFVPVIVPNVASVSEAEIFPRALRFHVSPDGTVTDCAQSLLAADLRETADGRDLALAKISASLMGVDTDEIFRRAVRQRKRRTRIVVATLAALVIGFAGLSGYALLQGYQVETSRRLAQAQLLGRAQPTEALLALADAGGRLFIDKSLLNQLTPDLIHARLTLARHVHSDSLSRATWGPNGSYVVASHDGSALLYSSDHRLAGVAPGRSPATAGEQTAYGKNGIPLSSAVLASGGKVLVTLDWRGCLRQLSVKQDSGRPAADEPSVQRCLNKNVDAGEPEYAPADLAADGSFVIARDQQLEIYGPTRRLVPLQSKGKTIKSLKLGPKHQVAITYANGDIRLVSSQGQDVSLMSSAAQAGFCADGRVWSVASDASLVLIDGARQTQVRLAGKRPWHISNTCSLYLDDAGDLYRIGRKDPLRKAVAYGWNYSGNAIATAFAPSDRYLAVSGNRGEIQVYDLSTAESFTLRGHTRRVFSMRFDATETRLLTASLDRQARIFDLQQRLIYSGGRYTGAAAVYSAQSGRAVVSQKPFDYLEYAPLPAERPFEVPAMPTGERVRVRQDWRVGNLYAMVDGDTQLLALCSTSDCPDEAIQRRLEMDIAGSGIGPNARASAAGEFLVVLDDSERLSIFDLRGQTSLPVLTLPSQGVTSATFSANKQELFMLTGDELSILPFGPSEIARRLRGLSFCFTPEERESLFNESARESIERHRACESQRIGPQRLQSGGKSS